MAVGLGDPGSGIGRGVVLVGGLAVFLLQKLHAQIGLTHLHQGILDVIQGNVVKTFKDMNIEKLKLLA